MPVRQGVGSEQHDNHQGDDQDLPWAIEQVAYHGQAENRIYPKLGATKLKDFTVTDADRFFREIAGALGKSSLVEIKSTLRRSIRRAQKHDLIGRNVAELVDLPQGRPGRPSRAMTEEQAAKVLQAASGQATGYVKVVKASKGRYGATHAATASGELACGTQVYPRHRDRLPARDRLRHPRRRHRHGQRLRRPRP